MKTYFPPARKNGNSTLIALFGALVFILLVAGGLIFFRDQAAKTASTTPADIIVGTGATRLVYAVHWSEKSQLDGVRTGDTLVSKGLAEYLKEYVALHPDISFRIQIIPYGEYADKLAVLSDADLAPDIYQIYSPWGVSFVKSGILDAPPADVVADVQKNYLSTDGVTIDGRIWGIPTEINDYALLYNKRLFAAAGLVDKQGAVVYPRTWTELVNTAVKLTKKNAKGTITQYGIAFNNEDWQVVNPFLTLLESNGGAFLSDDLSRSLFNSPAGVGALEAFVSLFQKGATDTNGNFFDFGKGKVAMVLSPPWPKGGFASAFGDTFETEVGVAPFPPLSAPASFGYTWFMGVMAKSAHKKEAWDFLKWFTSEVQQDTGTTRYGDLLADPIGAIPSRTVDFESHQAVLGDFFTRVFVDQMKYATVEPNVARSSEIKAILVKHIQSAWAGQKTAKAALDAAAAEVDTILQASSAR